jgi:hypothetical protein
VILFAQAEASLIDLVMDLGGFDQKKAQRIVNGRSRKRSVAALARKSGLEDFDLTELLKDIDQIGRIRSLATVTFMTSGSLMFSTAALQPRGACP